MSINKNNTYISLHEQFFILHITLKGEKKIIFIPSDDLIKQTQVGEII